MLDLFELYLRGPHLVVGYKAQVCVPVGHLNSFSRLYHSPSLLGRNFLLIYHNQNAVGLALRTTGPSEHLVNRVRLQTRSICHNDTVAVLRHF